METLTLTIEFQAEGERVVMCSALRDAYQRVLDENDDLPDSVRVHCENRVGALDEMVRGAQFSMACEARDVSHVMGTA